VSETTDEDDAPFVPDDPMQIGLLMRIVRQLYPTLLTQLGSIQEVKRLGRRFKRTYDVLPDGPSAKLAPRLESALVEKYGWQHPGLRRQQIYNLGCFLEDRASKDEYP
jgi:hypothetical protein